MKRLFQIKTSILYVFLLLYLLLACSGCSGPSDAAAALPTAPAHIDPSAAAPPCSATAQQPQKSGDAASPAACTDSPKTAGPAETCTASAAPAASAAAPGPAAPRPTARPSDAPVKTASPAAFPTGTEKPDARPLIAATLTDGAVIKNSALTFDVWAREPSGGKLDVRNLTVTLNGAAIPCTWDDTSKTSYTLRLQTGSNTVVISAQGKNGSASASYTLYHEKTDSGTPIGYAAVSIEAFTIGCGYLAEPALVEIYAGESTAQLLKRVLEREGYLYTCTGSIEKSFYLSHLRSGAKPLGIDPVIPDVLVPFLEREMDWFDPDQWEPDRLGEFDFTNGSGWMYCINHIFPNVGMSDSYPDSGDVIRIQYTLSYGRDNGGYGAMGSEEDTAFFPIADKDALTLRIAQIRRDGTQMQFGAAYRQAMEALQKVDATQHEIDAAVNALR